MATKEQKMWVAITLMILCSIVAIGAAVVMVMALRRGQYSMAAINLLLITANCGMIAWQSLILDKLSK